MQGNQTKGKRCAMDLISRQAAIAILDRWLSVKGYSEGEINVMRCMKFELEDMPSADVQPVRYGKWIKVQCKGITSYGDGFAECDKCHEVSWLGWNDKYCRNCGARMDEGRE